MQIQIIVAQATAPTKMIVSRHESGLAAVNHVVKAGEKITLLVDGVRLTGKEVFGKQKFKLVRVGQSLVVEAQDGGERLIELTDFYDQPDALLTGDQWHLADASQLQQLSEGVAVSALPVPATLSAVNVAAGQAAGSTVIGNVFGVTVSAVTMGVMIDTILNDDTSSNEISFDTQSPTAPVLALFRDTGDPTDRQTGNGQINVTGLEVGSTWQYSLDSGVSWQSGNGGLATTGTTGLFIAPAGTYSTDTILIKQTDAAGNESNESTLDTVIIDGLTGTAAADSLDAFDITNDDEQTIFGLAGDDSMTGADGDDLFIGGEGDDELRGEGGSDTFLYLNANDGSDLIRSFEIGSGGDKLVFGNWLGSLTLSDGGGNNLKITAGAVSVTLEGVDYANAHAIGDAVWLAQMQTNGNLVIL